jgi:hypothetical protein
MPLAGTVKVKSRQVRLGLQSELQTKSIAQNAAQATSDLLFSTLPQAKPIQLALDKFTKKGVILSGVNEIRWETVADIAIGNGLIQSVLQPWPVQPTKITISADSYMGQITLLSPSDDDVNQILKRLYQTLDEFWRIGNQSQAKEAMILEVDNNPTNHRSFIGFIESFTYTENADHPFMFDYTLSFVGIPRTNNMVAQAINMAKSDKGRA